MAGSPRDFPYLRAIMQASQDGEFGPAIQHAIEKYREDAAPERPNQAPKEFWPSTSRFRSVLYKAGKLVGQNAAVYLEAIPDADVRLFAQIELAAALAGLPELPECSANIITLLTARGDGCHAPPVTRWIPESGARNVTGLRMRRLVGPADAGIFGIRSIPAACALPADINGQSPLA